MLARGQDGDEESAPGSGSILEVEDGAEQGTFREMDAWWDRGLQFEGECEERRL